MGAFYPLPDQPPDVVLAHLVSLGGKRETVAFQFQRTYTILAPLSRY